MSHIIMMSNILSFVLIVVVLYLKPFYIISLVFFLEYMWILIYFLNLRGNLDGYHRIEIKEILVCNLSFVEIWIEYSKLMAFKRVYAVLSRKSISFYTLLKSLCFFILGIPKRFIDLLFYFIFTNTKGFRDGLENLYYHSYYELRYLKIEVLENKFTLNCNSIEKIVLKVSNKYNSERVFSLISSFKKVSQDFSDYELKNQKYVKMISAGITTEEGVNIHTPHYSYEEKGNIMHGTSNTNINLEKSQFKEVAINALIKEGAKNPGTIVSKNAKISFITRGSKMVPMYELDAVKYNKIEFFDLSQDAYKYIYNKNLIYRDLMRAHLGYVDEDLVKELTSNYYTAVLSNATSEDIFNEVNRYNKDEIL